MAVIMVSAMVSTSFAASHICPICHQNIDVEDWVADDILDGYHSQICPYCDKIIHEPHTIRYGECTVCGYTDPDDDDNIVTDDDCAYCGRALDIDGWMYSSSRQNFHYQICDYCDEINYQSHYFGLDDECLYCGAERNYIYDDEDIYLTISQDVGYFYFTDNDTQSGESVYSLLVDLLPYSGITGLDDYYVTFESFSNVADLPDAYYSSSCWLDDLDRMYIEINTYGTWVADYTVTLGREVVLTGTLSIEIEPYENMDIIYSASTGDAVELDISDFYTFWSEAFNVTGSLEYVRISSVSGLNGTLCYEHTAGEKNHSSASGSTFYVSPTGNQKALNDLTFVPAKSGNRYQTGAVTINFTAYGRTRNNQISSASGQIVILYTSGEVEPITYSTSGGYISLDVNDFNSVYLDATNTSSRKPSYTVKFLDVPAYGTLFRGYVTSNLGGSKAVELTKRNISSYSFSNSTTGVNSIDNITYVSAGAVGYTDTIRYAVYTGSTLVYIGTITFSSEEIVITYGSDAAGVKFSGTDFLTADSTLYGTYIAFGPTSYGTLYTNYANGTGTVVTSRDHFSSVAYSGVNSLDSITFVPTPGYTGVVEIPFFGNSFAGSTVSGKVRIYVVAKSFSDVDSSSWYASYVNRLYASGIVNGTSATTFSPSANMTYGEALKMILRAAGYPAQSETGGTHWASNYLSLAFRNGIVSTTNIDLDALVNRDAIAEIAAKALGLGMASSVEPGMIGPVDSTNGYVYALYNAGIVGGEFVGGLNYFHGSRNITRAEVAKIICTISDYKN